MDSDIKEIRTFLLAAIKRDRNMFTKAKIDPMFDAVRPEVDALLEDISQRTKANAEKEIADAEFAVQRMEKWFDGRYASSDDGQKYRSIRNKISDAKGKIKTQSYFGYDDALRIMSEANVLVEEIQASIGSDLTQSKVELARGTTELNAFPAELSEIIAEKDRSVVTNFLMLVGTVVLFGIGWWVVCSSDQLLRMTCDFPVGLLLVIGVLGYVIIGLIALILILVGIFGAPYMVCVLLWSIGDLLISLISKQKKIKISRTKSQKETIPLERRITAAEESLL